MLQKNAVLVGSILLVHLAQAVQQEPSLQALPKVEPSCEQHPIKCCDSEAHHTHGGKNESTTLTVVPVTHSMLREKEYVQMYTMVENNGNEVCARRIVRFPLPLMSDEYALAQAEVALDVLNNTDETYQIPLEVQTLLHVKEDDKKKLFATKCTRNLFEKFAKLESEGSDDASVEQSSVIAHNMKVEEVIQHIDAYLVAQSDLNQRKAVLLNNKLVAFLDQNRILLSGKH